MKRLFASLVVCSALCIGSGAGRAFGEDYVCPPGAKFCPAPGSGQASAQMTAPFGLDGAGTFNPDARFAQHASQLREGEQLIMVAPSGGGMAMAPASGPSAYAPAAPRRAAPVSGGMDFMPPPPGSRRPAASVSGPAGGETLYAAAPAPRQAPRQAPPAARRPAAAPASAAAPARRPAREQARISGPAARVEPVSSPFTPSPDSFARNKSASARGDGGDRADSRRSEKTKVAEKPSKKKRADMLSEVANETSRKSDKKAMKEKGAKGKKEKKVKADEDDDRVPWWKGGMWRNRGK